MSAMFQNAVAAIRMGIEDYALDRPERSLSAVRNFYAGVLLLAKEALVRRAPLADPDAVIGARYKPIPDGLGGITYVPDSRTTIDFTTLGKRFKDFGLEIDRAALTELSDIRNQVEHRFTNKPSQVVREIIAKAFPVTAQLFRLAGEDPRVQLGEAWTSMLEARALYEQELERCRKTLEAVEWRSATVAEAHLRCDDCGSDLIAQSDPLNTDQANMALLCQACGAAPTVDVVILESVERALEADAYIRMKDTGESGPVFECPACGEEAYIDFEDGCALCGEAVQWENCMVCHSRIPLEDALAGFDEGVCSYCAHIATKDD